MDWVKSHPWWVFGIAGVVLLGIWWYESHRSSSGVTVTTPTSPTPTRRRRRTPPTPTSPTPPTPPPTPTTTPTTTPTPTPGLTGPDTMVPFTPTRTVTYPTVSPQVRTLLTTPTPFTPTPSQPNPPIGKLVDFTTPNNNLHVPGSQAQVRTSTGITVMPGVTPSQAAAANAARAAAAAAQTSLPNYSPEGAAAAAAIGQNYVGGTAEQYQIAATLSQPASSYSIQNGYWVNPQGQDIAKVNPAGDVANGPNSSNMLPL